MDRPNDTPPQPAAPTVREALLAEALGDAHKLLERLEAMESRIQALAEQVEAKSTRFETQVARYTKAINQLRLAAQSLRRLERQPHSGEPPADDNISPGDGAASAVPAPASAPDEQQPSALQADMAYTAPPAPPPARARAPLWLRYPTANWIITAGLLVYAYFFIL